MVTTDKKAKVTDLHIGHDVIALDRGRGCELERTSARRVLGKPPMSLGCRGACLERGSYLVPLRWRHGRRLRWVGSRPNQLITCIGGEGVSGTVLLVTN